MYEKLGHAEVTQVELPAGDTASNAMQIFADKYFAQFRKTPFGMMRSVPPPPPPALLLRHSAPDLLLHESHLLSTTAGYFVCAMLITCQSDLQDPQDAGPGYRNVIGIPGGITSELFAVLKVYIPPPPLPSTFLSMCTCADIVQYSV